MGQSLHLDSGINGLPTGFGVLHEDHNVPLSVLIPLTSVVKIEHSEELTQHVCSSTIDEVASEQRKLMKRDTISIEIGKMLVFTHDFVHAGAKDQPNYRMFLALQSPKRPANTNLVIVI